MVSFDNNFFRHDLKKPDVKSSIKFHPDISIINSCTNLINHKIALI